MLGPPPGKDAAHLRERLDAQKKTAGGDQKTEAAILNYPMQDGQQELIQRAIGVIDR